MTHATDGLLQAYLDGEIDREAAAELSDHLAGCAVCAAELESLRHVSQQAHAAIGLLTAPPPVLRARAAIAAERRIERSGLARVRRMGARGFAKAAMLLLALAGAGAAAIPGSPVRRALESTIARVAELFRDEPQVAEVPAVPAPEAPPALVTNGAGVLPSNGRVRVMLHAPSQETEVVVRLVETPRAHVEAATAEGGVRFRTGAGRIEVANLTPGTITIDIPRGVQNATVEIDGRVYAYKQGNMLQLSGPAGDERGEQVRFRPGT